MQILRRERGQGKFQFLYSTDHDTSRTPAVDGHYAEKLEIDESIWEQSPRTTLM